MLNFVRHGFGAPLLLVHGLGGSWRSWTPVLSKLADARDVVALDLPGHGESVVDSRSDTFLGLADSVETFITDQNLDGIDVVGSSLGARIALELARRGKVGATIALDPGGFWRGWERTYFQATLGTSIRLVRGLGSALPALSRTTASRTMLLAQLSARPWKLDGEVVASELMSFAKTPTFDALVRDLASAPEQEGPAADGSHPVIIGWGRQDRLCLPRQAARANAAFPSARIHWFEKCGHFPIWDKTDEAIQLILAETGQAWKRGSLG